MRRAVGLVVGAERRHAGIAVAVGIGSIVAGACGPGEQGLPGTVLVDAGSAIAIQGKQAEGGVRPVGPDSGATSRPSATARAEGGLEPEAGAIRPPETDASHAPAMADARTVPDALVRDHCGDDCAICGCAQEACLADEGCAEILDCAAESCNGLDCEGYVVDCLSVIEKWGGISSPSMALLDPVYGCAARQGCPCLTLSGADRCVPLGYSGVRCGDVESCTGGDYCCTASHCEAAGQTCSSLAMYCDGPEDCGAGQQCCLDEGETTTTCHSSSDTCRPLCHSEGDAAGECPGGLTCQGVPVLFSWLGLCLPP